MERLSDAAIEIVNDLHMERLDYNSEYIPLIDALNRLAAYEDTGLSPEEIKELCTDEVAEIARMFRKMIHSGEIDHLIDLMKAEQEGRLVVLPCKVGDTVYVLNASKFHKGEVYEGYVPSFYYSFHGLEMLGTGFYGRVDDLLNKKVFLTRAEAEAALKGVSEDANN